MKDGMRFVDCDMHIMEPPDLFDRYLDPKFKDRVILPRGADGRAKRGTMIIDGLATSADPDMQQYRKRAAPAKSNYGSHSGPFLCGPIRFAHRRLREARLRHSARLRR